MARLTWKLEPKRFSILRSRVDLPQSTALQSGLVYSKVFGVFLPKNYYFDIFEDWKAILYIKISYIDIHCKLLNAPKNQNATANI